MASDRKYYWIRDFSGGIQAGTDAPGETTSADIQGAWADSSNLVVMRASATLPASVHEQNTLNDKVVRSHTDYVTSKPLSYVVAKRDKTVWLGIPRTDFDPPEIVGGYGLRRYVDCKELLTDATGQYAIECGGDKIRSYNVQRRTLWSDDVLSFDGMSSYLELANGTYGSAYSGYPTGPMLVSIWARSFDNHNVVQGMSCKVGAAPSYAGWYLCNYTDGKPYMQIAKDITGDKYIASMGSTNLRDGLWHHVVGSYRQNQFPRLFVDGVEETLSATIGTAGTWSWSNTGAFKIGRFWSTGTAQKFNGDIGQVAIYTGGQPSSATVTTTQVRSIYDATKPRYSTATVPTTAWYPLLSDSHYINASGLRTRHTMARSQTGSEAFAQVGQDLYMSPDEASQSDYPMRWNGKIARKGQLIVSNALKRGGQTPYSFSNAYQQFGSREWIDNGVRPGDILFVKDQYSASVRTGGEWNMRGMIIRQVQSYPQDTIPSGYHDPDINLFVNNPVGTSAEPLSYAIVRINRAGIKEGNSCYATHGTVLGSLATGAYSYLYRYGDSLRGIYGVPSEPSTTARVTATGCARVYRDTTKASPGWDIWPDDLSVDTLEIYRSKNGGLYNLATTVNMIGLATIGTSTATAVTRIDLAAKYVDKGWPTGATLSVDAYTHSRPDALRSIRVFNNRLYGLGTGDEAHWLKFSTLNNYDYFPSVLWNYESTASGTILGGGAQIGANAQDRVTAIVPEGGAYDSLGISGSNLLVFTESQAKRWFGVDWSDFSLQAGFAGGCQAPRTAANVGGLIVWCGRDRIMAVPSGGAVPAPLDGLIFPNGFRQNLTTPNLRTFGNIVKNWSACGYDGRYYLSLSLSQSYPTLTCVYDPGPPARWVTIPEGFNDLHVWNRPGWGAERILTGSVPNATTYSTVTWGDIRHLFSSDKAYAWSWLSRPIYLEANPDFGKTIKKITCCFVAPQSSGNIDSTVTLSVYADGDVPAFGSTYTPTAVFAGAGQEITKVASRTEQRRYLVWSPQIAGRLFQLGLVAEADAPVRLDWAMIEYVTHPHPMP